MNLFDKAKIFFHYGGVLKRDDCVRYEGGSYQMKEDVDIDKLSIFELKEMLKGFGLQRDVFHVL